VAARWCLSVVLSRIVIALGVAMTPLAAGAQSAEPPQSAWRASAGYETFSFRDVASSSPPVDGSPLRWEGSGPIVTVDYDRARPLRLHRFGASVSSHGDFSYETGAGTVPRPSDDGTSFLEGQYDYRRYLARELGVRGLRAGVGVRGAGERRVLTHHYGGVTLTETDLSGSVGVVAALRFQRFGPRDRFGAELDWTNAAALLHGHQHRETEISIENSGWGAGWVTDLAARGEVRVGAHVAAVISYMRRGEGLLFDLRSYTAGRQRVMAGITYAR
jgi:hypothetical protein